MLFLPFLFFIGSLIVLIYSGPLVVASLSRIAGFLNWQKFVLAFVLMSIVTSLPNLTIGVISSLRKIPQLSLGDVLGGNLVDFTLAIALATIFSKGNFSTESKDVTN